jgi:hypothetical protein
MFAVGALIAALSAPVALAGPEMPEYGGKMDKDADRYFGFDLKKGKVQKSFAVNLKFSHCNDPNDNGSDSGGFDAKFPVANNGDFGGTATDMFARRGGPDGIRYTIEGNIDGNQAKGTLKAKLLGIGCKTGEVKWKAQKPAPVPPGTP